MAKKDKKREGIVYSTNPDYEYKTNDAPEAETPPPAKQLLKISLDKKLRAGKQVTLVTGFVGAKTDLENLSKIIKTHCGVGGSTKEGEIIIQGDFRDQIEKLLINKGFKVKKIS